MIKMLTGTMMPNSYLDVYALLSLVRNHPVSGIGTFATILTGGEDQYGKPQPPSGSERHAQEL